MGKKSCQMAEERPAYILHVKTQMPRSWHLFSSVEGKEMAAREHRGTSEVMGFRWFGDSCSWSCKIRAIVEP